MKLSRHSHWLLVRSRARLLFFLTRCDPNNKKFFGHDQFRGLRIQEIPKARRRRKKYDVFGAAGAENFGQINFPFFGLSFFCPSVRPRYEICGDAKSIAKCKRPYRGSPAYILVYMLVNLNYFWNFQNQYIKFSPLRGKYIRSIPWDCSPPCFRLDENKGGNSP